jgi:hypothetical protein
MKKRQVPDPAAAYAALTELNYTTPDSVRQLQVEWGLDPTGIIDTATIHLVMDALAARRIGERQNHPQPCRAIKGRVSSVSNESAPNLTVRLVEQQFRKERVLAEGKTGTDGRFELAFPHDRSKLPVLVRVLDGDAVAAQSDPQVMASPLIEVDLTVGVAHLHSPAEYQRIVADVLARTGEIDIGTLRRDDQEDDITFLSNATGWPTDKLSTLVLATIIGQLAKIDPVFFYAILRGRQLLETGPQPLLGGDFASQARPELYSLALLPTDQIDAYAAAAIGAHIVPSALNVALPDDVKTLASFAAAATAYRQTQAPQQILDVAVANIAAGNHEKVLSVLKEAGNGDPTQLLGRLQAISFTSRSGAADVQARVRNILASQSQLADLAQTILAVPSQAAAQAADSATAKFAAEVEAAPERTPAHAALASLLRANPQFNLKTGNVDALLRTSPPKTATSAEADALRQQVKATQRVFKLAPAHSQTTALLNAGVHSAAQIAAMGKAAFVSRFTKHGTFTPAEAATVFQKANDTHIATSMIAAELRGIAGAATAAATAPPIVSQKLKAVSQNNPNLKNLFELIDLCECDDCRAIDSPAAYLADVLDFLKNRLVVDTTAGPPVATKTAKDVLFARRPELGEIDLSCDNTNVPLPYIDIVCELLEHAVAPDPGFAYNGALASGAVPAPLLALLQAQGLPYTASSFVQDADSKGNLCVRDGKVVCKFVPGGAPNTWTGFQIRQTFGSAAELAAAPEYVNTTAYQTLQASTIAFHLPFDLPHEESRGYFKQFAVPREDLMRALAVGGVPAPRDIAAEQLDISDVERGLIATPDLANQNVYWNTAAADPVTVEKVVSAFLQSTELQYADLQTLLSLQFINPGNKLFIQHLDSSCDTAQQVIANLDVASLDRIHRFLRLQRRLGWGFTTLDNAIGAARLGNGQITDDPLTVGLAGILTLSTRLNLSVDELIIYFGTIPTATPLDNSRSRYAQIFLSPSANGTIDPAFTIAAVTTNQGPPAPAVQTLLSDVAGTLSLTLGAAPADIALLIAARGANNVLSFANLSTLYSQISLARALGLKISDFLLLVSITGIDPFANPANAILLADANDEVNAVGVSLTDLQFALTFTAPDVAVRALSDAAVASLLVTLQKALQAAYNTDRSPFDPSLSADENEAALSPVVGQLPGVTAAQLSKLQAIVDGTYADPGVTPKAFLDALLGPFLDTTSIDTLQAALAAAAPGSAAFDAARLALLQAILNQVSDYLYQQAKANLVPATLASGLSLDPDLTTLILNHARLTVAALVRTLFQIAGDDSLIDRVGTPPAPPPVTPAAFPDQFAAVRLLRQIAIVSTPFQLANNDLQWLIDKAATLGWLDLNKLPYQTGMPALTWAAWDSLQKALGFFSRYHPVVNPADATQPFTFRSVLDIALAAGSTAARVLDRLTLVTGWDRTVLGDLDARFGFSAINLAPYLLPATYLALEAAVTLLRKLGLSVAGCVPLIKPQLTAADAQALRQALKARYSAIDWLGVLGQIYAPLRQQKRDALVAYLLSQNNSMQSSDDLFDYFLVDVEMCANQPTSRIVSAHGSLQLFVQRCLLGIEPTAVADVATDDGWNQWSWMEAYRVWQANRQVFLHPENWISPPLRDDKSEPFVALENALAQSDLSHDAINDAAIAYLEALDDLAFLEVMSMYYEQDSRTLHVFARTKGGDPHTYYYRTFIQERTWTPWTTVNLDIKGDHLISFIRNGRINIAWPIFTEQANQDQDTLVPNSAPGTKVAKTQRQWQIQLAVSEYTNGSWLPSKTSKDSLPWTPGFYEQLPLRDYFRFIPLDLLGAGFCIACSFVDNGIRETGDKPGTDVQFLGGFTLTGCKGYPEPFSSGSGNTLFLPVIRNTDVEDLRFIETSGNEFSILNLFSSTFTQILLNTPNIFRVTAAQQLTLVDYVLFLFELLVRANTSKVYTRESPILVPLGTLMPLFYEDSAHNYIVIPGFFSRSTDQQPQIRRTFSDVLTLLQNIITLFQTYLLKLEQDPNHDVIALLQQLVTDPNFLAIVTEIKIYLHLRFGYEFDNFYHPLVCPLRKTLYSNGIGVLMDRATQLQQTAFDFSANYAPKAIVKKPYPIEDIDFTQNGSYSSYNWELFFHLPLEVAVQLSADQQFEKAMDWFHYIFDPTDASANLVPQKYWQTKPFFQTTSADYISQRIDTIMNGLAADPSGASIDQLRNAVAAWRDNPFEPFLVARARPVAFQQAVLMKYIDNLIAWGDSLFTQDTMETVNQATQMYILADKLLGPRPRVVPPIVTPPPETYNQLEAKLDLFGNALLDLENLIPDLSLLPHGGAELPPAPLTLSSLYFCIPGNPNLDKYWDLVADRLFKIRNCQDINGVPRVLALFSPPIDPGALIAARAAGLSISQILAGLNSPLPIYRFSAIAQKATELTHLVIQFGSSLLQALEKRDAEALARLRSTQEISLLNALLLVKQRHVDEAQVQIDMIQKSIDLTQAKSQYYHSRPYMNAGETVALVLSAAALVTEAIAMGLDIGAAITHMLPTFSIGIAGFGGSPSFSASFGSDNIAGAESGFSQVSKDVGSMLQGGGQMASTVGGFDRRQDEWTFQATLADLEIIQLNRQKDAATIRLDIAQKEVAAHQVQIANAQQTDQFLKSKFTDTELYQYMAGQLSSVFYSAYQLALNVAHQAERCLQFELGVDNTYIRYNYWDSQKKGLLSGDRLMSDLKQMEVAYMQKNKREYELTKQLSLAQLDPLALLQLKTTGACTFSIPEASFDVDHPGHYFRRLKTVSLTIPCVTGPYTSVSAKLSLVGNRYRATTIGGSYSETPGNDPRFAYNVTAIQSVATSQGDNDSGLFELNFRDDRYLPFEYAGAISSWRLELPQAFPQFDYNAISDVILRIRYTARDGGSAFRATVEGQLRALLNAMLVDATNTGLYQGFDLRRQFPDQWYQLTQTGTTTLNITTDYLPYLAQLHKPSIDAVTWIAGLTGNPASTSISVEGNAAPLAASNLFSGRCSGSSVKLTLGTASTLTAADFAKLQELTFVVHYTLGA